jgi:hypothetical protein
MDKNKEICRNKINVIYSKKKEIWNVEETDGTKTFSIND